MTLPAETIVLKAICEKSGMTLEEIAIAASMGLQRTRACVKGLRGDGLLRRSRSWSTSYRYWATDGAWGELIARLEREQ